MLTGPEHRHDRESYARLVNRVCALIERTIPVGGSALVVSRGDGRLLDVRERQIGHFPQTPTGLYAGHHPADGQAAVDELERLRSMGAGHLVIPETGRWWLEHYEELRVWLETRGTVVADESGTGIVFDLERTARFGNDLTTSAEATRVAPHVEALLAALLPPQSGVVLVATDTAWGSIQDRFTSVIPAPGDESGLDVGGVLARIEEGHRAGARYLVLVNPPGRPPALNAQLSRDLDARFRSVCRQRLIEIFALVPGGAP